METFSLDPPLEWDGENYIIAVTNLEVYNSVLHTTEHNTIFYNLTGGY